MFAILVKTIQMFSFGVKNDWKVTSGPLTIILNVYSVQCSQKYGKFGTRSKSTRDQNPPSQIQEPLTDRG